MEIVVPLAVGAITVAMMCIVTIVVAVLATLTPAAYRSFIRNRKRLQEQTRQKRLSHV